MKTQPIIGSGHLPSLLLLHALPKKLGNIEMLVTPRFVPSDPISLESLISNCPIISHLLCLIGHQSLPMLLLCLSQRIMLPYTSVLQLRPCSPILSWTTEIAPEGPHGLWSRSSVPSFTATKVSLINTNGVSP